MIHPTATELLRTIDETLVQKVEPSLGDVGGRSALATVRHLLNFVRVRIEREGQVLMDDIAALRPLLAQISDYLWSQAEADAAGVVDRAVAANGQRPPGRYPALDDLAQEAGVLREALHGALARLQDMRSVHGNEPRYQAVRAEIRAYVVRQIEEEGEIVAPAFFGRGPRR
jgi:hypothetical protein